jgi:DNA modification methylase
MRAEILPGNVFDTLPTLKPGAVDCVVSSPPYWQLRAYLKNDHPLKPLELGQEKTPQEYVRNMVRVFDLVHVAMADHGTVWLNIGDTYLNGGACGGSSPVGDRAYRLRDKEAQEGRKLPPGSKSGCLALIPHRLAIALVDAGWILRSIIVWHKPAPMPTSAHSWNWVRCRVKVAPSLRAVGEYNALAHASPNGAHRDGVTDGRAEWQDCPGCEKCSPNQGYVLRRSSWRPTSSHEYVLMLAKRPGYFCDGEPLKQPPAAATVRREQYTRILDDPDEQFAIQHDHETICDGANLRDVWTIASENLKEAHYAAYPTELVARCLQAGTSLKGYCPTCGVPWCRVMETTPVGSYHDHSGDGVEYGLRQQGGGPKSDYESPRTIGWRPCCSCPEQPPRPGLVLDPFAGSGRTGIAANRLGLDFVGCELNPLYVEMARRLLKEACPLFVA